MQITTIGLDLAKHVFQVHAVDADGRVLLRKSLRRAQLLPFFAKLPRCLIGIEACGTSHHWARELIALGHDVRLMPPAYVKPYVKRGKTDAADAEAICEAVTRPIMRFVPVKSREQQALMSLHRTRSLLVKQRTQSVNMMRGFSNVHCCWHARLSSVNRPMCRQSLSQWSACWRNKRSTLIPGCKRSIASSAHCSSPTR
jgi:transposase